MKKVIAFYLPQYHTFPENDEWWGEGFTEWTNVKKARPLYKGHNQPRIPLNRNYYCLLDGDIQRWQTQIAKEYGVYGFCYYHYWFNGKLLMEKPIENMLSDKSVNMPFCMSWANESWSRTWDGRERDYLIKQEYGGEEDWEKHINYLLRFFRDDRYIKINDKPVFLLYTACRITNCREMVSYWKKRCAEEGLKGLYVVETLNHIQSRSVLENSDAIVYFEPNYSLINEVKRKDLISKIKRFIKNHFIIKYLNKYDIKVFYKCIEERQYNLDKKIFVGTCNDWDNSARKGYRAIVLNNSSPELFKHHIRCLNNREDVGEYLFVNAWNEWGEGAYLEPDERNGYGYLEAIKDVFCIENDALYEEKI